MGGVVSLRPEALVAAVKNTHSFRSVSPTPGTPTVLYDEPDRGAAAADGASLLSACTVFRADELALHDIIATGSHATVHRATLHGNPVAAKRLLTRHRTLQTEELEREVRALSRLQHFPHVVQLLGWARIDDVAGSAACALVMPLAACDLHAHIHGVHGPGAASAAAGAATSADAETRILGGIAEGMAVLHAARILHLDLNPHNVLLAPDASHDSPVAWITDFGLSATFEEMAAQPATIGKRGTLPYRPPELLDSANHKWPLSTRGAPIDVYAFGLLAWSVLARAEPWARLEAPQLHIPCCVLAGERPERPDGADWADAWHDRGGSPAVVELVRVCWQQDPGTRPLFAAVAEVLDGLCTPP